MELSMLKIYKLWSHTLEGHLPLHRLQRAQVLPCGTWTDCLEWVSLKLAIFERKSSVDLVDPPKHSSPWSQTVFFGSVIIEFNSLWLLKSLWAAAQCGEAHSEELLGKEATGLFMWKHSWHKTKEWQDFKGMELLWDCSGIDMMHPLGYLWILQCGVMRVLFQQEKDAAFGQNKCSLHQFNVHKANCITCTEKASPFLHLALLEGYLGPHLQLYLW